MPDKVEGIFISEILADNAGGAAIDTDGDGRVRKSDEFIELQNNSNTTVSLDGFEIWSEKNGLLYTFGPGDTIAPGDTATVVGNYDGTPPAGFYSAGIAENGNFIPDGENQKFDSIFLVNANTGEYIVLSYGDPPQSPTLPSGFTGTTQLGSGEQADSNAPNGTALKRDATGEFVEGSPTPGVADIPCFVKGTKILTLTGELPVEELLPGQRIITKDFGPQPLRGVGTFAPTRFERRQGHDHAPIVIPDGALGNARDLWISSSHRVVVRTAETELLFGEAEVLIGGRHVPEARHVPLDDVVYFHLLFDTHQIICAEGCWVESLFLADVGSRSLSHKECWKFQQGFDPTLLSHTETARTVLKRHEASILLSDRFTAPIPEAA